jgi:hypothetical protein
MGSLVAWGALGGAGKGLTAVGVEAQRQVGQEKHDARQVQLQRQRDAAALKRQQTADSAAAARMKEEWAPGGYREQQEKVRAGIAESAAEKKQRHEFALEEMRQKEATGRTRITEGESEFEWFETEAETTFDPFQNKYTTKEAERSVRDVSGTYIETGSAQGTVFVPSTMEKPTAEKVKAGLNPSIVNWLITAPNRELQSERKFKYLSLYGFLPPQYFAAYDPRTTRTQETTTTTQPANQ